MKEHSKVNVYLLDITGCRISRLAERELRADSPEIFEPDATNLSNGTYFVVAEGEHFKETRKLVITR